MTKNKLLKKFSLSIASLALICPLTLSSLTKINANASSNESRIINYNAHSGLGQGSAFHTPIANNPKDVHITEKDSMGFSFTIPGGADDYRTEKGSPLWNQIINKKSNPINKISWKQVNNIKWIYNALHKRSIYNYLKYNDKNKEDRQQIKQAYQDAKNNRVSKARKVYKMMWIKDYDFLHHGENYKNTENAMDKFDGKRIGNSKSVQSNGKVSNNLRNLYNILVNSKNNNNKLINLTNTPTPKMHIVHGHIVGKLHIKVSKADKILDKLRKSKNKNIRENINQGSNDAYFDVINIRKFNNFYYRLGVLLNEVSIYAVHSSRYSKPSKRTLNLKPGRIVINNYNYAYHYAIKHPKAKFVSLKETANGLNREQYAKVEQNAKNGIDKYDSKIENNNFNQDWKSATRLGLKIKK